MAGRLAGKRILVVEDEYFIAADMKRALRREDAIVVGPVGQLSEGIALAEDEELDAAVLDVNLDGPTPYALADRLAERNIPRLFVTGYDGWSLPDAYRDTPRLAKPFAMHAVMDRIVGLIEARS